MKAAIYCRLSKEDEDVEERGRESESIQNQKSMLIRYAIEKGYDIYNIYSDEDYSGVDRNRPAFNEMIDAASRHKFDIILAKTQSRFTRDMELVEKYLHGKFIEWGIRFIAVVDHVDTADPAGKKSRQINGLVNEWYLEDLSGNVRSVLTHKRKEGKYIGSFALYGYQKDPNDSNHLIIDPEAAEVVKRIFVMYLAGNGTTYIARRLNEEGVPSPTRYKQEHGLHYKRPERCRDEDLWGKSTIYRMLKTRTYQGDLEQGRHKKISYKSQKTVWLPQSQWIVVPNTHAPIIDPETFARVQQLLAERARGGGGGKVNPLARKVFCGICGTSMEQTGSGSVSKGSGRTRKYFRCRMSRRDKTRCAGQDYMPVEELQALVLERIRNHVAGYLEPAAFDTASLMAVVQQRRTVRLDELDRLQSEIKRRRKAMQELYLDKSSGLVGPAQFAQINQAFLDEVEALERRCVRLQQELDAGTGKGAGADAESQRQQFSERLHSMTDLKTLNRALVSLLIEKIVVYPPDRSEKTRKIEILWKF